MSKITVSIAILIISFLLIMLVLYLFDRREINIKKKSTFKTVGRVVGYNSKNEVPISLPIVEYTVNGKIYRKKYRYSYFDILYLQDFLHRQYFHKHGTLFFFH